MADFTARVKGDTSGFNNAMKSAGNAASNFASLLATGGKVGRAVVGLTRLLTPLNIAIGVVGVGLLNMARDGVAAFQELESQAVASVFRIHQSMKELRADLSFAMNTRGGPSNIISGIAAGLQAGLSPAQARVAGAQGARLSLFWGDDPAQATQRVIARAQNRGISLAEAGQTFAPPPPGTRNYQGYLNRAAAAERDRALANVGRTFEPVTRPLEWMRERGALVKVGLWDTVADAFDDIPSASLYRGGQHSRGRQAERDRQRRLGLGRAVDAARLTGLAQSLYGQQLDRLRMDTAGGTQGAAFGARQLELDTARQSRLDFLGRQESFFKEMFGEATTTAGREAVHRRAGDLGGGDQRAVRRGAGRGLQPVAGGADH